MYIFLYYLIFCATTALIASMEIYVPVLKELKQKSINHLLVSYTCTAFISIFVLFSIAAPIMLPILLSKNGAEIFKTALLKSFLS